MRRMIHQLTHSAGIRLSVALIAVAIMGDTAGAQGRNRSNVRAAIDSANARYVRAYNAGDVHTFAQVYAPDATLMPPNSAPIQGRSAIEAFWQGGWSMGIRNVKLTTTELQLHGDVATEVGRSELDVQPANGPSSHASGKYIVLWKRNANGAWQWYRDIFNSDVAEAPAGAAPNEATSAAARPARAMPGDSVWVVLNAVKADKRGDFEEFLRVFWGAGLRAPDAPTRDEFAKTRVLYPARANADGTYTYVFLMDPVISGASYSIDALARRLLPDAEARRILALMAGARATTYVNLQETEATNASIGHP